MSEENKQLYACPNCHTFYIGKPTALTRHCDTCKTPLKEVGFDYSRYAAFTDEQKKAFKKAYVESHFSASSHKPTVPVSSFVPLPQSGWVRYIGCCGWLALGLCLLCAVVSLMTGQILFAVGLAFAGALSCGALILFSIVAEDVRHIRNQVDKLHHDQKYKQP